MPITLYTDFDAKYKIANSVPTDKVGAELAIFIADYEREYLSEVLGYKMAKEFTDAIASNPGSGKWFELWKGVEFTDKFGRLNLWPGFRNDLDLNPIAMYIFYKWNVNRQTYSSDSGEKVVLTENSEQVTVRGKLVKAWNDMVKMNFVLDDFLTQKKGVYGDYPGIYGDLVSYGNLKYFKQINTFSV